jgi:transposase
VILPAPDTRWLSLAIAGYEHDDPLLTRERSHRMEVVHERCCGLDVHKRTVVACVLLSQPDGTVEREVRTCGDLWDHDRRPACPGGLGKRVGGAAGRAGIDWCLLATGVYWRPVSTGDRCSRCWRRSAAACWSIPNTSTPQHLKRAPGHKTDVKDAEWRAELLRHGLLHASFIPPQPVRDLRELTRQPQDIGPRAGPRGVARAEGAAGAPM